MCWHNVIAVKQYVHTVNLSKKLTTNTIYYHLCIWGGGGGGGGVGGMSGLARNPRTLIMCFTAPYAKKCKCTNVHILCRRSMYLYLYCIVQIVCSICSCIVYCSLHIEEDIVLLILVITVNGQN